MSNHVRRPRRLLAGMLAGALALSVTPILGFTGVASASHIPAADPIGEGNFCEDVPLQEPFDDVQTTDLSYEEIVCLVATQITTGVTATTYEPNSFVTRRQMALFLTRAAVEADRLEVDDRINELPAPADTTFTDTDAEEQFIEDAISQLEQANIAEGFPDNSYRPEAPVSRRQMAAFIDRLYEYLTGQELTSTQDYFADDDADSAEAQESTNAVAEAGIFVGNADGTFKPAQEITRRQMANVLTRFLQVLFENGFITQWADPDATPAPADVTLTSTTVEQGGTITGTITGADSATVAGCGFTDEALADTNAGTEGIQFSETIAATQPAGNCELTFTIVPTGGGTPITETETITVTAPAPTTNQDFAVNGQEAAVNTVSTDTGDTANRGLRQYSVSGLDNTVAYDVALFDAGDVTNDNGTVTFADADNNNQADFTANDATTGAVIEVVNGSSNVPEDNHVQVNPVNGTISFSVDSENPDSIVPVIFVDADGTGQNMLAVDDDGLPTEPFGIGGQKTWVPAEAGIGALGADEEIVTADEVNDTIITADGLYNYDRNDTFYVVAGEEGPGTSAVLPEDRVTYEQFEAALTAGDELDEATFYQPNPELPSEFILENVSPVAPTDATEIASETTDTSTVLTVDGVRADAEQVTVYCEVDANPTLEDTPGVPADGTTPAVDATIDETVVDKDSTVCATAANDADANTAGFQVNVTGLQPETFYDMAASQTVDGEESALSPEAENVETPATGETVAPTVQNAALTTDNGLIGIADTADVWTLTFSEGMNTTTATDGVFLLTDADGDVIQVNCGDTIADNDITGATCVPSSQDGQEGLETLTLTLTEDADDRNAAGDGVVEYALTITNTNGQVQDPAGNTVDLNSGDRVIG